MQTRKFLEKYIGILAYLVIKRCHPMIIGITGSVGKTTTTVQIAKMLENLSARHLVGTVKSNARLENQNDTVGVPLMILGCDHYLGRDLQGLIELVLISWKALLTLFTGRYPDILVIEYGISRPGEMDRIVNVAPPDIAIITTIGPAHLEHLGSIENVTHEKSRLMLAVPEDGLVVLGADNQWTNRMAELTTAKVELVEGRGVELAENIARTVGLFMGFNNKQIDDSIANTELPPHRLAKKSLNTISIIDDSFNANPLSMQLALDILESEYCSGRKIAILGLMAELGKESEKYHREIGFYAKTHSDLVIGIGNPAREYEPDHWFPDVESCCNSLSDLLGKNDCVLIKGSHSAGLHRVVDFLKRDFRLNEEQTQ